MDFEISRYIYTHPFRQGNLKNGEHTKDFVNEHFNFNSFEIEQDRVNIISNSENYEINYEIKSRGRIRLCRS